MKKLFEFGADRRERGPIVAAWQPSAGSALVAVGTSNGMITLHDRQGAQVQQIALTSSSSIKAIEWDREGENLAAIQMETPTIPIYNLSSRSMTTFDTNMKEPTFILWSKVGPQLAVGGSNGNLVLYNRNSRTKVPIIGKHAKRITCGTWSRRNEIALGADDRWVSLSNVEGDTIQTFDLKYTPVEVHIAEVAADGRQTCISANAGGKQLALWYSADPNKPVVLAFQHEYGQIASHAWCGESILLAFSGGYLLGISARLQEVGEETFCWHPQDFGPLTAMAFSAARQRAAILGDLRAVVFDTSSLKEVRSESVEIDAGQNDRPQELLWSADGQILTIVTRAGSVQGYLGGLPSVSSTYGRRIALLSNLREVSIYDSKTGRALDTVILESEPSIIALGKEHLGVMASSKVAYYRIEDNTLVNERTYAGKVEQVLLSTSHAAVLCDNGKRRTIVLQPIKADANESGQSHKSFPESSKRSVTCLAMTDQFLAYGDDEGKVQFFSLPEWCSLPQIQHRHSIPLRSLYSNLSGNCILLVDISGSAFLYHPVKTELLELPGFPSSQRLTVLWDTTDRNVIMVYDGDIGSMHAYVYCPITLTGSKVIKLGALDVSARGEIVITSQAYSYTPRQSPLLASGGYIASAGSSRIDATLAPPYDATEPHPRATRDVLRRGFCQNLALLRLREAWKLALQIDDQACWLALSGKAMEVLDVDMATTVYRELGDAGMVLGLEQIRAIEDRKLLAGHIALLFGDYAQAQELFLTSSHPAATLEMHRDLLHWDQALKVAQTLAPKETADIAMQYAHSLEFQGDYEKALTLYEMAMESKHPDDPNARLCSEAQYHVSRGGSARCKLRMGNLRDGMAQVLQENDQALDRKCAAILEANRATLAEAAGLYERAECFEKAAAIYLQIRSFAQVARIISQVTPPKLHAQYAKACEQEKRWQEAAESYERAHDMDSVIRIYLQQLNDPEKAFLIARRTNSAAGALIVAQYCQDIGDVRGAVEFLLIAQRSEDAFALAKAQNQMEVYTTFLAEHISPEEARNTAQYYETKHDLGKAGKYYSKCGQYARALKLFLQCGEQEVEAAIDAVGKARNDMLTHLLIDFLMGETDGRPKDPNYIYKLYMALGNFVQASKTAVIIARQEQELGNYKVAHGILYDTIRQLEGEKVHVPQSLRWSFVILHSYILVKVLVKHDDHEGAARMLLRVAKHISRFPAHNVRILTSVVVECQRAGLKISAYDYASMLCMNAEYRQQVDAKFKRKIEAIVRRPVKEETPEKLTMCPISGVMIPCTDLECPTTKDALPMCVVSGRHMEAEDWCTCPNSGMPALYSEYVRYIQLEEGAGGAGSAADPVCGRPVDVEQLERIPLMNVPSIIAAYNSSGERSQAEQAQQ